MLRQVRNMTGHSGVVFSVSFSPDGTRVVSGSEDGLVKVWEVDFGTEVSSFGRCGEVMGAF